MPTNKKVRKRAARVNKKGPGATVNGGTCSFKGCPYPAKITGYCGGHYMQLRRHGGKKRALRPLGAKTSEPSAKLSSITITKKAMAKLKKHGPTIYRAARGVIERWAARRH